MPIEFAPSDFGKPLVLIAGPCVIESEEHVHRMARGIREAVGEFVFKASFDKANRTSAGAYRGPGLEGRAAHSGGREGGRLPDPDRYSRGLRRPKPRRRSRTSCRFPRSSAGRPTC